MTTAYARIQQGAIGTSGKVLVSGRLRRGSEKDVTRYPGRAKEGSIQIEQSIDVAGPSTGYSLFPQINYGIELKRGNVDGGYTLLGASFLGRED
jgi:hypothetical protein